MRILLYLIGGLGTLMCMGAAFLIIDQMVTDDHRSAVRGSVNASIQEIEDSRGRWTRGLRGLIASYKALEGGIFRSKPVGLAAALPNAPDGWQKLNYAEAHGEALTGKKARGSALAGITTEKLLNDFKETAAQREMGAAATYVSPSGPILLRLSSSRARYRRVEEGQPRHVRRALQAASAPQGAILFARLDGLAIHQAPQITQTRRSVAELAQNPALPAYTDTPVSYKRYTFGLGRVIEGEILTSASPEDVLSLLSGLDIAPLQASLPYPTSDYVADAGLQPALLETSALN